MTTVKAGVFTATDVINVEEVELLPPGAQDIIVRIGASGLCHSDLSVLNGSSPLPPPLILGHEGAGTVEWVGDEVSRVKVGDRVIASLTPTCGRCWHCTRQETHLCEAAGRLMSTPRARRSDGTSLTALAALGTFSEAMTINQWSAIPVRTGIPDEELALIGCGVATGLGAVLNTARVGVGATVAVIGFGGVGAAAVQGARVAGASRVVVIDPVTRKRESALLMGASDAIDPQADDPVAKVRELTGGRGVDYAFEAVGALPLIDQALAMTRRGGSTVLVGAPRYDVSFSVGAMSLIMDDRRVLGSFYGSTQAARDFQRYIDLIETGRLDIAGLINERITLSELPGALPKIGTTSTRTVIV